MTKPADERTAKARERELEERAREFKKKWLQDNHEAVGGMTPRMLETVLMARFAESERKEAREECARAVCAECDIRPETLQKNSILGWAHFVDCDTGGTNVYECKAAAIRALGERS